MTPAPASARLDQLAGALAARFTDIDRGGAFETARRRLVSHALTPSKLYSDSTVWPSVSPSNPNAGSSRELAAIGALGPAGYRFTRVPPTMLAGPTYAPGETRHDIRLQRLSEDQYRWETTVDFAMGTMTSADVGSTIRALFVAPQSHNASELRLAATYAFPKATSSFAKLFAVDSFQVTRAAATPTAPATVYLRARLTTSKLRGTYPHFAAYIDKYVRKSRYRFRLTDRAGATFIEMAGEHDTLSIRYRVAEGEIVSLAGPARRMPDTLRLRSDVLMRGKLFDLGFHDLLTDVVRERTARSQTWTVIARSEPRWDLPLITERFIRAPLRRPFQGDGARFTVSVHDGPTGTSLLTRHAALEVQESAIMRFIGGFIASVLDDHDAEVEKEQGRFLREGFEALRADAARKGN